MVSKVLERIHAESAARLLEENWTLADIPEPLDFEVRTTSSTFGLEVTQVFTDQEKSYGSRAKRQESLNSAFLRSLADTYYARGGKPVSAKLLGPLHASAHQELVEAMLQTQPQLEQVRTETKVGNVKVFMTALPSAVPNTRFWTYVDDKVGWLRDATASELQHAVNRKSQKLAMYKKKYESVVLLLVADRTFNSGRIRANASLSVQNPGFTTIYFLSHPEAVTRVA